MNVDGLSSPLPMNLVIDRLIVGVSGSISAVRLPEYLVALRSFYAKELVVLATRAAETFMHADVLGLYADKIWLDAASDLSPGHVELADWAEDFIVLPATMNLLAQAAQGLAPGRLTATMLAWPGRVTFFPSANSQMWSNPTVIRNVAQLRADGHIVVEPVIRNVFRASTRRVYLGEAMPEPDAVIKLLRRQRENHAEDVSD